VRELVALAELHGLIATGGSDYHGPYSRADGPGGVVVPSGSVDHLQAALRSLEGRARVETGGGRWS